MKITAPNKQYTGVSASVAFANGVGHTDNPHLIRWFREHGYTVESTQDDTEPKGSSKSKGGSKSTGSSKPRSGSKSTGSSKPRSGSKSTGSSKPNAKDSEPQDSNEDGKLPTADGSQEKEGEQ